MGEQLFLERFLWFHDQVCRKRYPNATKLSEEFEISSKTAQRSIEYFRDRLQVPLQFDRSQKGYLYTDPTFQLPGTRISEKELLALLISQKLISEASTGTLGDELKHISKRLNLLLTDKLSGYASPEDVFSFRWKAITPTDPQIFMTVTSALLQRNLLTFCYQPPTLNSGEIRTVEPHHMVNYMGNWYLIAFCHLRNDWRNFLLGRMTECQRKTKDFETRSQNLWQPYLLDTFGIFQSKENFDVKLRFTPQRSLLVKNEMWHEKQTVCVDDHGSLYMTVPTSHEAEIMMEILKHGSQVEVLEPEWLRNKVVKEIKESLKNYEKNCH
jgi:predicted DNA-binding transcriptional regulator YafY